MMGNYFSTSTAVPAIEITKLIDPDKTHPKEAKVRLAKEIVTDLHDNASADAAAAEFDKVFAQRQLPDDIPEVEISPEPILASKLLLACTLVSSGSEAKRMIKQAAVSINGQKINDPNEQITPTKGMVIQVGKRKFARLRVK